MRVFHKTHARRLIRQAARAVGVVPIHQGIVKAHAQTLGARRFHELRHQVAAARLLGSAVVGELRFKIAEALVMLGGHHHVFLPGTLSQLGPLARGVRFGRKVLRQKLVLRHGNALDLHRPLVLPDDGVKPPVDEHAESCFVPPLHPPVAAGLLLGVGRTQGRGLGSRMQHFYRTAGPPPPNPPGLWRRPPKTASGRVWTFCLISLGFVSFGSRMGTLADGVLLLGAPCSIGRQENTPNCSAVQIV